jgi:hypothetical protein
VRLLLTVPNGASAPVFLDRLGWSALPPLRVWARVRLGLRRPRAVRVARFGPGRRDAPGGGDRVLRDGAWLNWRFADGPGRYVLLERAGYAAARRRGPLGVVAAVGGDLLADCGAATGAHAVIAAPPPGQERRYLRGGYVPTHRTFTVLGKALHPDQGVPARPHFELGDLDFL